MLLLTAKGKETTFAVVLVTVDSQLKERDTEGFCDSSYPHCTPEKEGEKNQQQQQQQ